MPGFEIKQPVSIWNKELKVDFKSLFKNLTKGVVHGVGGKWDDVSIDLSEVATSLGLQKDKAAELAWLLIWRALQQAIIELAKDYFQSHGAKVPDSIDTLVDRLDLSLEQAELTLTSRFFDRPDELPIIKLLQTPLSQWLQGCGVSAGEADAVAARLPSYFVLAVIAEWRQRASDYQLIRDALQSSPFRELESQELAWKHYTAVLARQVDEPVFGAAFGLRQIYVPLRAWYAERREEKSEKPEEIPFGREKMVRVVVPLEDALRQWLHEEKRTDAIRIVSGGPGSGKSTSVKLFAWEVSSKLGRRVLFIPLHWFDVKGDLSAAVARYARNAARLPRDPLDPEKGETKLLLIFDGLDELASQGAVGYQAARDFVEALQDAVRAWNESSLRVQVLLSGRTLVINELENRFRQPGQILHLVPYFEKETDQYEDPANLLATDQRQQWWQQYGRLTGKPYQALPSELIHPELDEVTAQPLLNYLVAIALDRGIQITKETNLNSVYEHLIGGIFKRPWAEEQHPALQGFKDEHEFFTVLEEIAVAIWQGSGRAATKSEILARCQSGTLEQRFRNLELAAQEGVTRLLTAFYFRRAEGVQGTEPAFEFSHKSFGEYLVARRLVWQVKITAEERARRRTRVTPAGVNKNPYSAGLNSADRRQWIVTFFALSSVKLDWRTVLVRRKSSNGSRCLMNCWNGNCALVCLCR